MEIRIKYEDLIARCEQLSSFESEGKVDAAGQSRYLEIHINEVDKQLVQQYIEQAKSTLEEKFNRMIESTYDYDSLSDKRILKFDRIFEGSENVEEVDRLYSASIGFFYGVLNTSSGNAFAYYKLEDGTYKVKQVGGAYSYEERKGKIYENTSNGKMYTFEAVPYIMDGLVEYTPYKEFVWSIRTGTRWNGLSAFTKHVSEAIVAYTMSAWLSDKLPDRVAFYDALFIASTEMAVKNIFKKQAPRYEE